MSIEGCAVNGSRRASCRMSVSRASLVNESCIARHERERSRRLAGQRVCGGAAPERTVGQLRSRTDCCPISRSTTPPLREAYCCPISRSASPHYATHIAAQSNTAVSAGPSAEDAPPPACCLIGRQSFGRRRSGSRAGPSAAWCLIGRQSFGRRRRARGGAERCVVLDWAAIVRKAALVRGARLGCNSARERAMALGAFDGGSNPR